MKRTLLALCILSTAALAEDESVEPPLQYTLTIGNKSHQISEGKPFEIGAARPEETAVLTVAGQRVFAYRGLSFPYPRYFTFEADLKDSAALNWTLSGNDCTIMIFAFSEKITPQKFAEGLAGKFGKDTRIGKAEAQLGGKSYSGAEVDATIAGTRMIMEILPLSDSMLFVVQDSVSDRGAHSEEHAKFMAALEESFQGPK